MHGFLLVLTFTLLLAIVLFATGWAVGDLARIRCLRGRRLEVWLGRAFLGTACWMLVFGLCSHLGGSVRTCRVPLALGTIAAISIAARINPPTRNLCRRASAATIAFLVGCVMALALVNWPLVYCAAVWPFNDTLAYCSISHWLQNHGFGEPTAFDPDLPATRHVNEFQVQQWRMGSTFLLALVQGYTGLDPLLAFPVVMGWGLLLNLGGIFLLARWGMRLNRWIAAGASLCAASALNPLYTSIHQGFQPQMFGTAFLLASLALLCRSRRPECWTKGNAFFLAASFASLISAYSELAPILAMTAAAYLLLMIRHPGRDAKWWCFAGTTVLFLALLGNIEWIRALHAIRAATGVAVGYPILWSDWEYLGFATGQLHFSHRDGHVRSRLLFIAMSGLLLVIGVAWSLRDRRLTLPAVALLLLAGMALWFRFAATDPQTGTIGHRWSLFKIAKWAFPLLLVFQFAGLSLLLRRFRLRPALGVMPAIVALAISYTHHREYNQWAGRAMRDVTGSSNPVDEWRKLREELDRRGVAAIYLEHPGRMREPYTILPCVLYPCRFVNGWKGSELEEVRPHHPVALPADAIVLTIGGAEGETLPGNIRLLSRARVSPDASTAVAVPGIAIAQKPTSR